MGDTSAKITAAVGAVSVLLTLGILSQGKEGSLFQDGLSFGGPVRDIGAEDEGLDAEEKKLFPDDSSKGNGGRLKRCESDAEVGSELLMHSAVPALTAMMSLAVIA